MKLMRLKILRNFTLSLGIAALAFYAASAGANTERPTAIAADEGPTYAVEDLNYPDADKIWEEQGIKLIRGDGNIVLAECEARSDLIRIASRQQADTCFEVKGTGGTSRWRSPRSMARTGTSSTPRSRRLSKESGPPSIWRAESGSPWVS